MSFKQVQSCEAQQRYGWLVSSCHRCSASDWFCLRPADGQRLPASSVPAAGVQPARPLPAPGTGLRRARAALHRQRGAEERGGQVQRIAAHHAESAGMNTPPERRA